MDVRVRLLSLAGPAALLSLAVVTSVVTSTVVASRAYLQKAAIGVKQYNSINVKGSVRQRLRSDKAAWQIRVSGEAGQLPEAYAILEAGVARVQEFLRVCEFPSDEIGLGAIDMSTYYANDEKGNATRQVSGYALSRSFFLTTADVDRVCNSAGKVTELLKDGVQVMSHAPEYYYTQIADLKIELLGKAAQDARQRADAIAAAAGARVADVRDAQMGVLQITRPLSTETSSYGMYDTSTIEKDVTAVVTLTLGLTAKE